MKLDLSDFTLCAADSENLALTARAMHLCMEQCKFGDAVVFSHEPVAGAFRSAITKKLTRDDYRAFRMKPPVI